MDSKGQLYKINSFEFFRYEDVIKKEDDPTYDQKAFEKLMQGKTVIIIAHRLSTIRNADKIIVMEKGHLVEEGKHDELVAAGGRYAQMWNHYTEAIGWKISGKAV